MLEKLFDYERELFLQLNGAHSLFGDQFMWLFSGKIAWIPVATFFLTVLFYANRKRWKETLIIFGAIVLVITLCDQFASSFCKPFFARFRPTYHPDFMNEVLTVFDYRGGRYGFISSHAANSFGFVTLTSLIFRNKAYSVSLYLWATVFAYSRIYLGVHFISDILAGAIAGLLIGWMVYKLFVFVHKKTISSGGLQPYPNNGIPVVLYMLYGTIMLITIVSILYACHWIPGLTLK